MRATPSPLRVALGAALLACAAGCAYPTAGPPGLPHLSRVDEGLWRSALPDARGLETARRLGVRTVVSLCACGECREAPSPGLRRVRIPVSPWQATDAQVAAFLAVATDPARRPVLVHCRHGADRTGLFVAVYRVAVQGWSRAAAAQERDRLGASTWLPCLRAYLHRFDPAAVLAPARRRVPTSVR